MSGPSPREVLEAFYVEYYAVLASLDLNAWPAFFSEDCLYRVTTRENHAAGRPVGLIHCEGLAMVRDRAQAVMQSQVFQPRRLRYFGSGLRILSDDGRALRTTSGYLVVQTLMDEAPQVIDCGECLDLVLRTASGLRFRERACVRDSEAVLTSLVYPL